ncbi:(2Fe-2S)-binding protein [Oceanobacillus halophilus]|uniref:(2Fe-2S)-binding protein n=1 Tax=Oceanobacillus halophilus TaxID=930130 RepID=A0A495ACE1_9BACI|nr:(2Fe-2S)-binding protein [Oceanobacillus halophilus]RKQ37264.1 (2Fe-2S)-binding protein [Oceanobacillus halophilus]
MRISNHPVLENTAGDEIEFTFDGKKYLAKQGETIAAALLAHNIRILRYSMKEKRPRGIYCGIGHCYECRVLLDGQVSVRACLTRVRDNMTIVSEREDSNEF